MAQSPPLLGSLPDGAPRSPSGVRHAWPSVMGSIAVLAGVAASVGVAAALFFVDLESWAAPSKEPRSEKLAVLVSGLGPAAIVALGVLLYVALQGGNAVVRLRSLAARLSPLCLACAIPFLASYRLWASKPLPFLIALSVTGLLLERTLRHSFGASSGDLRRALSLSLERLPGVVKRFAPPALVLSGAAAYAAYTGFYSIQQHQRLATLAFDLGIYDNLMFNTLEGYFFRSPVLFGDDGGNYIAGHAEFIMVAYAPLYALWPRPEMLLVLQSVLLGFAAFPLYLFARTQIPRWSAVVVSFCYLLYAPLHGPNFYDFHWLPTAIFFHFLLYYAIAESRRALAAFAIVVLLLTREDVPVGLAVLGAFLAITGIRVRFGIVLSIVSVLYFVVVKFAIMPWAGKWWFANIYKDLIPAGESGYGGIIRTLASNPSFFLSTLLEEEKLVYALHLFVPVLFLPWRWAALALLSSVGFFATLMTTGYKPTISIAFQYTTHWIPYVFAATVLGLRLLGRIAARQRAALAAVVFASVFHSLVFGALLQRETFIGGFGRVPFKMTEEEKERYEGMLALVAQIPEDATVAATESEVPHVSSRLTAYALRGHHGAADYLLVNRHLKTHVRTGEILRDAFANYEYGLVDQRGPLYLFKRDFTSPDTERAKRELRIR